MCFVLALQITLVLFPLDYSIPRVSSVASMQVFEQVEMKVESPQSMAHLFSMNDTLANPSFIVEQLD